MHIGTVKWFNSTKGYGFVEPNDKSRDVFIHISRGQRRNRGGGVDLYPTTQCFYVFWLNLAKIAFL